jgi:hypothetical protein
MHSSPSLLTLHGQKQKLRGAIDFNAFSIGPTLQVDAPKRTAKSARIHCKKETGHASKKDK